VLAIIGGSGLTQLANLEVTRRQAVRTPYGEPSGALTFGRLAGRDAIFLARHGYGHTLPPHQINYRANVWALHAHGAKRVVAVAAVGGIRADLQPGMLALPDQIIDYTHSRAATFFNLPDGGVRHIDFTWPYSSSLRAACQEAARRAGIVLMDGGVYAATQGPRLETAAEINRLERDGADMVGMTGMPEAALAKEIGLDYVTLAAVVNHAAGRGESRERITVEAMDAVLRDCMRKVQSILEQLVAGDGG